MILSEEMWPGDSVKPNYVCVVIYPADDTVRDLLKSDSTFGWSQGWRLCLSKQLRQKGFAHIYKCFLRGPRPGSFVFPRLYPPLLFIFSVFSAQWNQIPSNINPSCDYRPNIIQNILHFWRRQLKEKTKPIPSPLGFSVWKAMAAIVSQSTNDRGSQREIWTENRITRLFWTQWWDCGKHLRFTSTKKKTDAISELR